MDRNKYTKEECWIVADKLADDRLPSVNSLQKAVYPSSSFYAKYVKRMFDILISSTALILTSPINILIWIGTAIDVGRPLLFKQSRVGKDGRLFTLYKFRNMRNTTDGHGNLLPAAQRVTRFGRFVRKTSLDELLNFWSVLKGDMSIIGPRPLLPEYTHRYSDRHRLRLHVRPGLECPPHDLRAHPITWHNQFENDIWYVENVSFATDVKCIINLVKYAFDSKSATVRGAAKRTAFMGYDENGIAISVDDVPDDFAREVLTNG